MIRQVPLPAALAVLLLATAPAGARDLSPGAAAAIGVLGGLAIGSAVAGAAAGPYYPGRPVYAPPPPPPYVPAPPRPVYYEEAPGPVCYVRRTRFVNEYGDVIVRPRRFCE